MNTEMIGSAELNRTGLLRSRYASSHREVDDRMQLTKDRQEADIDREEVETRKIGRNETRTFQGLFPGAPE